MADTPETKSPDKLELRGKPQLSAHLNKRAAFIIFSALAVILLIIVFNVSRPSSASKKDDAAQSDQADGKRIEPVFSGPQSQFGTYNDLIPKLPPPSAASATTSSPPALPPASTLPAQPAGPTEAEKAREKAMQADTAAPQFAESDKLADSTTGSARALTNNWAGNPLGDLDPNQQGQKQDFIKSSANSKTETKLVSIKPPNTKFEIKTGTVIPSVLITDINSDLPGEIVAQVSQNVFDTATGQYLLIPQGTKLFGRYDSKIVFGQERLLVSWNRLIYPGAETVELGGMSGHDKGGMSGFSDRVNHHYMRMIGAGLLMSVFTAGVQLSQPEPPPNTLFMPQQTAVGAMGQQMMQLGMAITQRHLNVQPTIEIRKGYQFVVMVNKDLVFEEEYK